MSMSRSAFVTRGRRVLTILCLLFLALAGREANGSLVLSMSDTLPSGPAYAVVNWLQDGTGKVKFTVDPDASLYTPPPGVNFGVDSFGLNMKLSLLLSDFKLPPGWIAAKSKTGGLFGTFSWMVSHTGTGSDPLVFDVAHSGITPSDFNVVNGQGAQFGAHIIGFTTPPPVHTAHWVSNGIPIPEPSTSLAFLSGAVALLIVKLRRRQGRERH
jgi:hypothetical protein